MWSLGSFATENAAPAETGTRWGTPPHEIAGSDRVFTQNTGRLADVWGYQLGLESADLALLEGVINAANGALLVFSDTVNGISGAYVRVSSIRKLELRPGLYRVSLTLTRHV